MGIPSQGTRGHAGTVQLASLNKGDALMAGALRGDPGSRRPVWSSARVGFSAGLSAAVAPCVYIAVGGATPREVFCAPDQPVALSDGRLTTADRLRLTDALLDSEGLRAPIRALGSGPSPVLLHTVATTAPFDGTPNGHLLWLNGLLVGDYELQTRLAELDQDYLALDYASRSPGAAPNEIGIRTRQVGFLAQAPGNASPVHLSISDQGSLSGIPDGTRTFFTSTQIQDVAANGTLLPTTNPTPKQNVDLAFQILGAVFTKITFTYDPDNLDPTVYAYKGLLSGSHVQINGGLARQSKLQVEGTIMAVAWGIGCLVAGKPQNADGYSAVGLGDLYAFETIARRIWSDSSFLTKTMAALAQWQALFNLVSPEDAKGNPDDPIDEPSLACRIQAVQSGIGGGTLPGCAGGSLPTPLRIDEAVNINLAAIELVFNEGVFDTGVANVSNYTLDPTAHIISAYVDPGNGRNVLVNTSLTQGQHYMITVKNLESVSGGALDPDGSSASFST